MTARADRWLAGGLVVLALALAANALAGPLVLDLVSYPFSETLVNQTVGLEAVTLLVVVPWCGVAARLVRRGSPVGPIAAIPPTGYAVYMFAQYVVGPGYLSYGTAVALHLGIFVLAEVLLVVAWRRVRLGAVPSTSRHRDRRAAVGLFLLAAFTASRYLPAAAGVISGAPLEAEFRADPSMYWSIVLLDLGVVVPATVATGIGLRRGSPWARRAVYGIAGWFTLVPVSVAAMGLAMLAADDPNASVGTVALLSVAAVLFVGFAAWVYRPLGSLARGGNG